MRAASGALCAPVAPRAGEQPAHARASSCSPAVRRRHRPANSWGGRQQHDPALARARHPIASLASAPPEPRASPAPSALRAVPRRVRGAAVAAGANGRGAGDFDYDIITIGAGSGGVRGSRFAASYGERSRRAPQAAAHGWQPRRAGCGGVAGLAARDAASAGPLLGRQLLRACTHLCPARHPPASCQGAQVKAGNSPPPKHMRARCCQQPLPPARPARCQGRGGRAAV